MFFIACRSPARAVSWAHYHSGSESLSPWPKFKLTHLKSTHSKSICCSYFQPIVVRLHSASRGLQMLLRDRREIDDLKQALEESLRGWLSGFMVGKEVGPIESTQVEALEKLVLEPVIDVSSAYCWHSPESSEWRHRRLQNVFTGLNYSSVRFLVFKGNRISTWLLHQESKPCAWKQTS